MNQEHQINNDLKKFRKQSGLRQIDVAEMLGHKSADRISHWEKGLAVPGLVNLFKLSVIYGTTPTRLYGDLYKTVAGHLKQGQQTDTNETVAGSNPNQVHTIAKLKAISDADEKGL